MTKTKSTHHRHTQRQEDYSTVPGLKVTVGDGPKAFEKAMRIFGRKVQASGLLREIRSREQYEKPSVTRKRAKAVGRKKEIRRREAASPLRKRKY